VQSLGLTVLSWSGLARLLTSGPFSLSRLNSIVTDHKI
jgi:hypothetical protein